MSDTFSNFLGYPLDVVCYRLEGFSPHLDMSALSLARLVVSLSRMYRITLTVTPRGNRSSQCIMRLNPDSKAVKMTLLAPTVDHFLYHENVEASHLPQLFEPHLHDENMLCCASIFAPLYCGCCPCTIYLPLFCRLTHLLESWQLFVQSFLVHHDRLMRVLARVIAGVEMLHIENRHPPTSAEGRNASFMSLEEPAMRLGIFNFQPENRCQFANTPQYFPRLSHVSCRWWKHNLKFLVSEDVNMETHISPYRIASTTS